MSVWCLYVCLSVCLSVLCFHVFELGGGAKSAILDFLFLSAGACILSLVLMLL